MPPHSQLVRILVIDDEKEWSDSFSFVLRTLGYQTEYASSFEEARVKIEEAENNGNPFHIATIDKNFEPPKNAKHFNSILVLGEQILQYIKREYPYIACIIISGDVLLPEDVLDMRDDYALDYFLSKDHVYDGKLVTRAIQRAISRSRNPNNHPRVFISYRRQGSWGLARAIANSLRERHVNAFLDVDDINQGRFDNIIDKEIREREFFVPILSPQTLDSEWVIKEINKALVLNKTIIPLFVDGFEFSSVEVPALVADVQNHNGFSITPRFYESAMDDLVKRFLSKQV